MHDWKSYTAKSLFKLGKRITEILKNQQQITQNLKPTSTPTTNATKSKYNTNKKRKCKEKT